MTDKKIFEVAKNQKKCRKDVKKKRKKKKEKENRKIEEYQKIA